MPSLFIGASRSASLYIRLDISKYSNVCWKECWCFNYLQSCIFQYEFVSNKHANRNFVNILNYVITFHDQAIPRKNPPVKPPARYTFSAANSWNCSKPFWKKEQRSFNKRPNSICYSYFISQVINSLGFDITFPFFDRLAFVLSAAAAQSLDSCCQLTLT